MLVLGIETSCDETAVAIVSDKQQILVNIVLSQLDYHSKHGGVVPEIASRCHIKYLHNMVLQALRQGNVTLEQIDAIAVTAGPGLIGGLLVGVMFAKGLASAAKKTIIAVNHLEGHALTVRLTNDIAFPYLMLLVSGGHCQILQVDGVGCYKKYGTTLDDAIGESFDKVARMLGMEYPGGAKVEKMAKNGDIYRYNFPKPLVKKKPSCNFSFSGLKTAVKQTIDKIQNITEKDICDICASFQYAVTQTIISRLQHATKLYPDHYSKQLVIAGGVAANQYIKDNIINKFKDFRVISPPIALCTDNAAMIAWTGVEKMRLNQSDHISFQPKSRWQLV